VIKKTIKFNQDWQYAANRLPPDASDNAFADITLPHTNKLFSYHNIDNQDYQIISTYRKKFTLEQVPKDAHIRLVFDGVMLACEVYLNEEKIGGHLGGFSQFFIDLTGKIEPGENTLTVYVDSRERTDIPPYGHLVDYLTFGGIYRDVDLQILPPVHIEDIFAKPANVLDKPELTCDIRLNAASKNLQIEAALFDPDGEQIAEVSNQAKDAFSRLLFSSLPEIQLWDLDHPTLYTLQISLIDDGKVIDTQSTRIGFREAGFNADGNFYLNGKPVKLFGLNRHQTFPFIGAAAPARLQRQDADILKYQLACNIVRTSHYPQSPHFLNRCDEIGLLVFEEMTGWQQIGDQAWQDLATEDLEAMIVRDRNHPSIILWGVRVNESPDNDPFYTRTNRLAHQLDPTRQTGGVRNFLGSSFLEDVYTYNDFSNTVLEPERMPHLITEFAGHMFPTKIWDHEERLIEHALLHAKIHNLQLGNPRISGAIGWCAFDYATHIEFGSGDRICYHGVMDTFRLPKWAGNFYQSQVDPQNQIVLKAATHWTMGDRAAGGNNPLTIFTNCDEVEVIIGPINVGRFKPDSKTYPNLRHPPVIVDGLDEFSAWGQRRFYDLHLIGYRNQKPVAEQKISSNNLPQKLLAVPDTHQLFADGSDMTRLILQVTDDYGNPIPYAPCNITLDVNGPAEIIGDNPFLLIGGQGAVYIKAKRDPGTAEITVRTTDLPPSSVSIELIHVENLVAGQSSATSQFDKFI